MEFDRGSRMLAFVIFAFFALIAAAPAFAQAAPSANRRCANLASISLPHAKVLAAQWVPQGAGGSAALAGGPLPRAKQQAFVYKKLPAFCRVLIEDQPSAESNIKIEIWLPGAAWNGKYRGQGNGGFAGSIFYGALAAAVREGYATAATDTGHTDTARRGLQAAFAVNHPEKVKDFGWRAIHEMTLKAKAVIRAYYGREANYSYFASCSDGGREALMEAQRFPDDYNGIIAGDPANNWTALQATAMWDVHQMELTPTSYIPAAKVPAIAAAVLAACDAKDGVRDGILNDPRQCHFDPESMLCKNGDSEVCLLPGQVETLKKIYAGPHDAAGHQIFPGFLPGAENGQGGWIPWITGRGPRQSIGYQIGSGFIRYFVYQNPDWDPGTYNIHDALKLADHNLAQALNANDTDLAPFAKAGGKLILYQGWNDPAVPALSTLDYYNGVIKSLGRKQSDAFVRLYMVPGMQHCGGGSGPADFGQNPTGARGNRSHDIFTALEQWVEQGKAPARLIAVKPVPGMAAPMMSRPLCPYPETPKYTGKGSTSKASNFRCTGGLQ